MVIEDGTPEYDYICLEILDSPDWDNGAINMRCWRGLWHIRFVT